MTRPLCTTSRPHRAAHAGRHDVSRKATLCRAGAALLLAAGGTLRAGDLLLAQEGGTPAPIILPDAPAEETLRAARTLADCIGKSCGIRPEILPSLPDPLPQPALWIGIHPRLGEVFPKADFAFGHPEEIRIVCDGRNVAIAGRDRSVGGSQVEFGTANAVYTFLQQHLGVRWFWPGPSGEDVPLRSTLAVPELDVRFHPVFRQRRVLRRVEDWGRVQRIRLDSLNLPIGHAFGAWWERHHAAHPEYFALQPDGTRSGYPGAHNAKLCEANPAVWEQWLADAAETLRDPAVQVLNAAPNDGSGSGLCVCDACRAWDHPDGALWPYDWKGTTRQDVALSDRYITFWNQLARGLRERHSGRDAWVSGFAYGQAKNPPIEAQLEPNTVISFVGHLPLASDEFRTYERALIQGWSERAPRLAYRPNVFYYSGGWHALPTLALRNTIEDFRFLADHRVIGLLFDGTPSHWALQGPQYYLLAQLAWDPRQDGEAVMLDYYRRGFGPAARAVQDYFELMEAAHIEVLNAPAWRAGMGVIRDRLSTLLPAAYSPARMRQASALLDRAAELAAPASEALRERVAFVRTGLDFAQIILETLQVMTRVRATEGRDADAVRRAVDLCAARREFYPRHGGLAINGHLLETTWIASRKLQDYLGPPSAAFLDAAGPAAAPQTAHGNSQ